MEITKLKSALKNYRGSISTVVERSGFSRQYVRQVLSGKYNNLQIIEIATTLLSELSAQKKTIAAQVAQVLQEEEA